MDPVSAAGLALGVAGVAVQIYSGCIQGIQMVITAIDYPEECKYLNLRLRMEQHRLFAWSETSGLLSLANDKDPSKLHASNTFSPLQRATVIDLLIQIQTLFAEFSSMQERHGRLSTTPDPDGMLEDPDRDARAANVPLPSRRRDFIKTTFSTLREKSVGGLQRFRWLSFDKDGFEGLLGRFASLNDSILDLVDMQLQVEIRDSVQDTNRGVLQLHHRITDLGRLVKALNLKLDAAATTTTTTMSSAPPPYSYAYSAGADTVSTPKTPFSSTMSRQQRDASASSLEQLASLARFKAFNASIDSKDGNGDGEESTWDEATGRFLHLAKPDSDTDDALLVRREDIEIDHHHHEDDDDDDDYDDDDEGHRSEAWLRQKDGTKARVWIEWKDYDAHGGSVETPSKQVIIGRVRKLAALLNHTPKPEAFRTPHCLGFFDKAAAAAGSSSTGSFDDHDILNHRLGLVFARPTSSSSSPPPPPPPPSTSPSPSATSPDTTAPVSLRDLVLSGPKPSATQRVALAYALANCLMYLHAVNWLHKGLRSHNIVFFPASDGSIDYASPCLSGFDFSRPARSDEETDMPGDHAEHNLYRHPLAQTSSYTDLTQYRGRAGGPPLPPPPRRERFKKSFDIYALGVLLFEIAHWAPINVVFKLPLHPGRGSVALEVRRRLLGQSAVDELKASVGDAYAGAARTCVHGGEELGIAPADDETDGPAAATLCRRFYEKVVKELGRIVV